MSIINRTITSAIMAAGVSYGAAWLLRRRGLSSLASRSPDMDHRAIIAPADGVVAFIKPIREGKVLSQSLAGDVPIDDITKTASGVIDGWLIGIYPTAIDSKHIFSPIKGTLERLDTIEGTDLLPMLESWEKAYVTFLRRSIDTFERESHFQNPRTTASFKGKAGDSVSVVTISAEGADGSTALVPAGSSLELGEPFESLSGEAGIDLVIPDPSVEFVIDVGSQVYGGQTVVATKARP